VANLDHVFIVTYKSHADKSMWSYLQGMSEEERVCLIREECASAGGGGSPEPARVAAIRRGGHSMSATVDKPEQATDRTRLQRCCPSPWGAQIKGNASATRGTSQTSLGSVLGLLRQSSIENRQSKITCAPT
jgi:hypothetical protein